MKDGKRGKTGTTDAPKLKSFSYKQAPSRPPARPLGPTTGNEAGSKRCVPFPRLAEPALAKAEAKNRRRGWYAGAGGCER